MKASSVISVLVSTILFKYRHYAHQTFSEGVVIMKKLLPCMIFICCLTCATGIGNAVHVDVQKDHLQGALDFGKKYKDASEEKLKKIYCIGSCDPFSVQVIVRTKWHKLARMAGIKAAKGEILTEDEQKNILSDNLLQIDIVVHGNRMDFAEHYSTRLAQGKKSITPEKLHSSHTHRGKRSRRTTAFPEYTATIRSYFRYDMVNTAAPADLYLNIDGKEKKFTIDFNKYK